MPIALTNDETYQPEPGAPVETYTHVQIKKFTVCHDDGLCTLVMQYGTYDGSTFAGGSKPKHQHTFRDTPEETGGALNDATGDYEVGVIREADPAYTNLSIDPHMLVKAGDAVGTPYLLPVANGLNQYLIDQGLYDGTAV